MVLDLAWLFHRIYVVNLMVKLRLRVNITMEVSLYLILGCPMNQFLRRANFQLCRTLSIGGSQICLKVNSTTSEIIEA